MKAVDAENSKNLTSDGRRLLQIMKAVAGTSFPPPHTQPIHLLNNPPTHLLTYFLNADPNHNWSKFSTGNLATLRDHLPPGFNIRTALLDLYKE